MRHRIITRTGLIALAALSLAATGCGSTSDSAADPTASGGQTTAGATDAKQELTDAAAKLGTTSYKLTLATGGFTGTGTADPVGKKVQLTMGGDADGTSLNFEIRGIAQKVWMKFNGLPIGDGKWLSVDLNKLPADSQLNAFGNANDPGGSQALIKAIKDAESLGSGRYKGTLDLSTSPNSKSLLTLVDGQSVSPDLLIVPFEATVDDEGRLTWISIDQSALVSAVAGAADAKDAATDGKVDMKFSDFGVKVDVQEPPAGEVQALPDSLLKAFGG